jgi:SAM-dependent methyltransferase
MSARKQEVVRYANANAAAHAGWVERSAFFHSEDLRYLKFLIPEGARILELGCGIGQLLAALKPSFGVGVDLSEKMIAEARKLYPTLTFHVGDVSFIRSLPTAILYCSLPLVFTLIAFLAFATSALWRSSGEPTLT